MMSFGAVAPAAMALDIHSTTSWWRIDNTSSDEGLTYFKRIAGADRYETMKKIVKATYNTSGDNYYVASVAVLASGENFLMHLRQTVLLALSMVARVLPFF
jgi:hypothetical protein